MKESLIVPTHAISVHQPWAWAIVAGHKIIENRTWAVRHRGPIAIHASTNKTFLTPDAIEAMAQACPELKAVPRSRFQRQRLLASSSFEIAWNGQATLVACTTPPRRLGCRWRNVS